MFVFSCEPPSGQIAERGASNRSSHSAEVWHPCPPRIHLPGYGFCSWLRFRSAEFSSFISIHSYLRQTVVKVTGIAGVEELHPGLAAICSTRRSQYVLIFSQISVLANLAVHQIVDYRDIVNQFQTPGWAWKHCFCNAELQVGVMVQIRVAGS